MYFLFLKFFILLNLANASSDCPLDLTQLNGALDPKSPKIQKMNPGKLVDYHFIESALLKNGWTVSFREGGCAHYGMIFTYEKETFSLPKSKKRRLAYVKELLNGTPMKDEDANRIFHGAIDKAKGSKDQFEDEQLKLPCGDATCLLDLSDQKVIKIIYDFAL